MWMQLYHSDGFTDEFESKVIENRIRKSRAVSYVRTEEKESFYVLKKGNIHILKEELKEEAVRQYEKSLFKKHPTRTLKELRIIIKILGIVQDDFKVEEDQDVIMFIAQDNEEILDM